MKRFIFWIILMSVSVFLAIGGDKEVILISHKDCPSVGGVFDRAPFHLSIHVTYDSATRTVEVTGDDTLEAEVYLYSSTGVVEDYSPTLNSTLTATTDGIHHIHIQGDGWYADGEIAI